MRIRIAWESVKAKEEKEEHEKTKQRRVLLISHL
jgi:hypothetical protein